MSNALISQNQAQGKKRKRQRKRRRRDYDSPDLSSSSEEESSDKEEDSDDDQESEKDDEESESEESSSEESSSSSSSEEEPKRPAKNNYGPSTSATADPVALSVDDPLPIPNKPLPYVAFSVPTTLAGSLSKDKPILWGLLPGDKIEEKKQLEDMNELERKAEERRLKEEENIEKLREWYRNEVVERFGESLEDMRKNEPDPTPSTLELLVSSLTTGADLFTTNSELEKEKGSIFYRESGGSREVILEMLERQAKKKSQNSGGDVEMEDRERG